MSKNTQLILYAISPFDWWSGWIDLTKFDAADFAVEYDSADVFSQKVNDFLNRAKALALNEGWEGDISQGSFFTVIPNDDNDVKLAAAWKQSNNGSTFIASELPLPHISVDGIRAK